MGLTEKALEPWICPHGIKHTPEGHFCKKCLHDAMWGETEKKSKTKEKQTK